jgi:hypothetical protein
MAFSSNSIINHRREGIYKGPLSSTSSKGSSSSTKRFGIDFENSPRLPLNLKNLSKASLSKPSPKLLHSSHTFKKSNMSSSSSSSLSKKRSRENDPFEIEAYPAPTGVEEMGSAPAKRSCPETGRSEVDIYRRRKKVTKYAASIRQNKTLARKASGSYARMPTSAQKGISNPGPLCYRISLLQTLLHQPKFVNWLLESHRPKDCVSDRPDECVPCFLVHLVLAYWKGEQHSVKISAAFHGIDKLFEYRKSCFPSPHHPIYPV